MRDAKLWAQDVDPEDFVDDPSGWQVHKIEDLIREAQQDGVREALHGAANALKVPNYKALYEDLAARYAALFPEGA